MAYMRQQPDTAQHNTLARSVLDGFLVPQALAKVEPRCV